VCSVHKINFGPSEPRVSNIVESSIFIRGGLQNKAGIGELPDSSKFIYNLEGKAAKKAVEKVWKNPKAKKEVLDGLERMDKGELLPRNQKRLRKLKGVWKEKKFLGCQYLYKPRIAQRILTFNLRKANITSKSPV
jgi:hypothetical protein